MTAKIKTFFDAGCLMSESEFTELKDFQNKKHENAWLNILSDLFCSFSNSVNGIALLNTFENNIRVKNSDSDNNLKHHENQ
jgi:hypothetical protein